MSLYWTKKFLFSKETINKINNPKPLKRTHVSYSCDRGLVFRMYFKNSQNQNPQKKLFLKLLHDLNSYFSKENTEGWKYMKKRSHYQGNKNHSGISSHSIFLTVH